MIAPSLKKAFCHVMLCSQLGLKEFPVEKRWKGIYDQFLEFIHSGCKEEMEESFTGFHIQTSKELRKSQEYLFCQRYEYCMPSLQMDPPLRRQNNSFRSINPLGVPSAVPIGIWPTWLFSLTCPYFQGVWGCFLEDRRYSWRACPAPRAGITTELFREGKA